jgi:amidohydrolase
MELRNRIQQLSSELFEDALKHRRHLHAHPELSFQEFETSKYVDQELDRIGISKRHNLVNTGIVGLIEGSEPSSRVVALRADMDALPIFEENDIDYKSTNAGVMHACGHDVHTTSLLGAANILSQTKDLWKGTVKLIFQPGEEKLPGGASLMIKEGVLNEPSPKEIYGQHVYPELEAGKVGFKPGIYMASADEVYLTVKGRGGHAAMPHNNIDPVIIASHVLIALQSVSSRNANPEIPTVLSFGKVEAAGATNVIPNEVRIAGTFRTLDEKWRFEAHDRIKEIATSVAKGLGGSCDAEVRVGYPFVINDENLTKSAMSRSKEYLGADNVVDLRVRMTGEDFAYFSQEMPGCFYRLGTSGADGSHQYPVHNSHFNIDETALETGMGLMAWLAVS